AVRVTCQVRERGIPALVEGRADVHFFIELAPELRTLEFPVPAFPPGAEADGEGAVQKKIVLHDVVLSAMDLHAPEVLRATALEDVAPDQEAGDHVVQAHGGSAG